MENDIGKMTDEQLMDHISKLNTKLAIVQRLQNSGAYEQVLNILNQARAIYADRAQSRAFLQMMASRPAEIISDPSLRPDAGNEDELVPQRPQVSRVTVRRSSQPSSAIDLSPEPPKPESEPKK